MAGERKIGVPLDAKTQERAAELVGLGLSQSEAARAVSISEKSVERILRKPEYKKVADDVRRRRTSVTAQAASVVQELLSAADDKGEPNHLLRKMGAELVMKNPALLESVEDLDGDDTLLPGVVLRFPWGGAPQVEPEEGLDAAGAAVVSDSLSFGSEGRAEDGCPPGAESENGLTLAAPPPGESPSLHAPLDIEPLLESPLFTETDYR